LMQQGRFDEVARLSEQIARQSEQIAAVMRDRDYWDVGLKCIQRLDEQAYATSITIATHPSTWRRN